MKYYMTVDVEDWFNILDTPSAPPVEQWGTLESRFGRSLERMLELFDKYHTKITFFWLGWFAEHYPELVKKCAAAGHEIACHGYEHLLAYQVGEKVFFDDISKGKKLIEDLIGKRVDGFRAAGFSTTNDSLWVFDEIAKAGYRFDSSVFPAGRGHGGMLHAEMSPYTIQTQHGNLCEFPQSVMEIAGKRFSVFGGGYLRLAPQWLIHKGIAHLEKHGRPLIVYVHPREIDPEHPRLPLPAWRHFKCYVNLKSTWLKLETLCSNFNFEPLGQELTNQQK